MATGASDDLRARATEVVARLAPGQGLPRASDLAVLAEADTLSLSTSTDSEAAVFAACLAARARRDALGEGTKLITRSFDEGRLSRPGTLSSGMRSHLYSSAGEYCAAIGWPQMGARLGMQAVLFASSDPLRYRALSVAALGHALNGEYPAAEADIAAAEELFARRAWPGEETAYLLLLAQALVAAARLDTDNLLSTAQRMSDAQPDDPYTDFSSRAIRIMARMITGDLSAGRAESRQLQNGSRRHESHRMMRQFLVCMVSDILVAQGEFGEALAILRPHESPDGHGICFSMQRSAALLQMGRESDLLRETEACTSSGVDHCLRTLTPLLIRRALALNRLGHHRRARDAMEAALLMIARTGLSATPFLMLPHDETRRLMDEAIRAHPELSATAPVLRAALAGVATHDAPRSDTALSAVLSATERALVPFLVTPVSVAEIARERGVSPNTVKSQVRSIYRKLGVGTRAEAVERLTRSGCG